MTLILTVANSSGVHQSSDYQLTDPDTGAPISDRAGSKQLDAGYNGLYLQLAFTGIASVRTGLSTQRTIDWLSAELKALPHDSSLQDICSSLSKRSAAAVKPLGPRGALTLILAVAEVGRAFRVVVISNTPWGAHPPRARDHFDIAIHTIKKPFSLISGYRDSVPLLEQYRMKAIARAVHASENEIRDGLAAINAIAAQNSRGYVSKECWVTSQQASPGGGLRSAGVNVGEQKGFARDVRGGLDFFGGLDSFEWIKKNFQVAPGKEIGLRQRVHMILGPGDVRPLPTPEGNPRKFTLSGSSMTRPLMSPSGQHCASIEIAQLDCAIFARCNEEVTLPFARVHLHSNHAMCADFPKPLLPWSQLSSALGVDGAAVPRGWEYTVGYWIEGGMHHVEIPASSRGVRNLAFLGDDDELVIVVPASRSEFAWRRSQDAPTATLQARICWRSRLDGARG